MEFSKKYLLKYGWTEGTGLGKNQSGIKSAYKPKLKFDKAGMGYDHSIEFTNHWWEKVYNDALSITTIQDKKLRLETNSQDQEVYNQTIKRKKKTNLSESDSLFRACEGRTAHKGARHGLQLSAKLQRLERQEKMLLEGKTNARSFTEVIEENDVNISVSPIEDKFQADKSEEKSHPCKKRLSEKYISSSKELNNSNVQTVESRKKRKKYKNKHSEDLK